MDLLGKLSELATRHAELADALGQPDATDDMERFTKLNKDYAELTPVVEAYTAYKTMLEDKAAAEEMIAGGDADMKDLAEVELEELREKIPAAEQDLKILLLPKDEADDRNIILEIRAGTGGDEAALFAGDMFRMYANYAKTQGWQVEIQDESAADVGGFKEIIARISGVNVYQRFKYESGTHRVQRVPATESQGRIHTSAVTVAVLPEAEEVDVNVNPADLRIDIFRSSGPGGQSVNTTDSAVRITHVPTGVVATCQDEKSQHKNREKAMKVLLARILDAERQKAHDERADARKSMVGSGDRSERIRTYNFPQSRVTDHRVNLTLHSLDAILAGEKLDDVIEPLAQADQAEKLAALGA
ncbi:MAG: peptide chain release factor 1 [Alphaproteobacteria bacterium]|nr:peptide chain release factor 1 [Alphaproteobacteria bacterium]MDD9919145.1 peptide chain release factor 1 [Alphaproteobacteria bacterium]